MAKVISFMLLWFNSKKLPICFQFSAYLHHDERGGDSYLPTWIILLYFSCCWRKLLYMPYYNKSVVDTRDDCNYDATRKMIVDVMSDSNSSINKAFIVIQICLFVQVYDCWIQFMVGVMFHKRVTINFAFFNAFHIKFWKKHYCRLSVCL